MGREVVLTLSRVLTKLSTSMERVAPLEVATAAPEATLSTFASPFLALAIFAVVVVLMFG